MTTRAESPTTSAQPDRTVAAALAGSAAASAAVPADDAGPASLAWRWVVGTDEICLYAADASSPDWRATCLGAGGALHRARVALAAEGFATRVTALPEGPETAQLARLVTAGSIEVTPDAVALYDATVPPDTGTEPTGPDPTVPAPTVPAPTGSAGGASRSGRPRIDRTRIIRGRWPRRATVRALVAAARTEGVRLRLVVDSGELAGVLHGPDTREAWLRAGAALSAVRLTARRHGLATVTAIAGQARSAASRGGRRRVGEREGWLGVGIGTPYVRLRLVPS
ncbi:MAG TPA: hypothetical protein VH561_09505 [Micromonosporaceae bacterium]|jgi:hypothetical protein